MLQGLTLLLAIVTAVIKGQAASGDADQVCVIYPFRPSVVNQHILMASFDYRNLLESIGGPWVVVDKDGNNDILRGVSTPMV